MAYQFSAGHYAATYFNVSIGTTSDGFGLTENLHKQEIRVDEWGDVPIDGVIRGTSCFVELDYMEYQKIKLALYQQSAGQIQGAGGGVNNASGSIGTLQSTVYAQLVLTPAGGTNSTTTYTFKYAVIDDTFKTMLNTKVREGRVRFNVFPDPNTGLNYTAEG